MAPTPAMTPPYSHSYGFILTRYPSKVFLVSFESISHMMPYREISQIQFDRLWWLPENSVMGIGLVKIFYMRIYFFRYS